MGANCCKTEEQAEKLTQDQPSDNNAQQEKSLTRPVDSMHTLKSQRNNQHNLSKASDTSSMYYSCAGDDDKKRFFAAYHQEEGAHGNPYESRSRFSTFARKGLPESSLDAQVYDGTNYRDRHENEISISKIGDSEGVSMSRNPELEKEVSAPAPYNGQFLQHPDLQQDAGDSDDDEFFEPRSHMSESRFSERPKDFDTQSEQVEVEKNDVPVAEENNNTESFVDAQSEQIDEKNDVPVAEENNDTEPFVDAQSEQVDENNEVAAAEENNDTEAFVDAIENEEDINENNVVPPSLEINIAKEENIQNTQPEDIDTCDPKTFPTENFEEATADQDGEAFLSQNSENLAEVTEESENQNIAESEQNKVEITA